MHGSSVTPAFVEFNMNAEGFGCLYFPSIAPQGPPTPSVVSGVVGVADTSVIGGIGSGKTVNMGLFLEKIHLISYTFDVDAEKTPKWLC